VIPETIGSENGIGFPMLSARACNHEPTTFASGSPPR
jgi:hypothetical protein